MVNQNSAILDPKQWVEKYGDYLYRYARVRVFDPGAVEDLVQETFLAALRAREGYRGKSTERTWLTGILRHKIVDYIRKQSKEKSADDLSSQEDPEWLDKMFNKYGYWAQPVSAWDQSPDEAVQEEDFQRILSQCLEGLPGRLASAFVFRDLEDMETETICKKLDITSTNLWVILHRARMRLRNCLQKLWFDEVTPEV